MFLDPYYVPPLTQTLETAIVYVAVLNETVEPITRRGETFSDWNGFQRPTPFEYLGLPLTRCQGQLRT